MIAPRSKSKYSNEQDKATLPFMTHLGTHTASLLPYFTSRNSHKPCPDSHQEELDSLLDGGVARSYTRRAGRMRDTVAAIFESAISLMTWGSQPEAHPCFFYSHNVSGQKCNVELGYQCPFRRANSATLFHCHHLVPNHSSLHCQKCTWRDVAWVSSVSRKIV